MDVRSASYLTDRVKVKSIAPMFVSHSLVRIDSATQRFRIADAMHELERIAVQRSESARFPSILVLNMMVPMQSAVMLRRPTRVRTANIVSIHTLAPATCRLESDGRPTAAMDHFAEWYAASLSEAAPALTALKFVPILRNMDEALSGPSIPSAVASTLRKMNGKPVLAGNTVTVTHSTTRAGGERSGAPLRVLELDVDMQQWSYIRRKALDATRTLSPNMELTIGWLIEGRSEAALPEQVFARLEMNRISIELDTFRPAASAPAGWAGVGEAVVASQTGGDDVVNLGGGARSAAEPTAASAAGGTLKVVPRLDRSLPARCIAEPPVARIAPIAPPALQPAQQPAQQPVQQQPRERARHPAQVAPLEDKESSASDDTDNVLPTALAADDTSAPPRLLPPRSASRRRSSRRSSNTADAVVICCGGDGVAAMCVLS